MEEQSDTPRMSIKFSGELGMSLLNRIAQLERERDEARALNVEWSKKAETWMASPEAAQRLQGYRELGQQVAKAQNERDEARAEVERLRKTLDEIAMYWNGSHSPTATLDAAEWARDVAEKALAATEAEAGVSWGGHNVRGDADSIAEVRRLIEFEDARQGTKPATVEDIRIYDAIAANYVNAQPEAEPEPVVEPVAWEARWNDPEEGASYWPTQNPDFYRNRPNYEVRPLYANPPRDEWRPASEPPEDGRDVVVWCAQERRAVHGMYVRRHPPVVGLVDGWVAPDASELTHWRDVTPPGSDNIHNIRPLYAHPPRDEWRLASEPPEDDRSVLVWMPGKLGGLAIGRCSRGNWSPYYLGSPVTHWRDVTPPTESPIAAKCQRIEGSGEICGLTPPCPDCGSSLIDVAEGAL